MTIDGTYIIEIERPNGKLFGVLKIQAIGNGLCGSYEANGIQPVGGIIEGNEFKFYTGVGNPPKQVILEFNGNVIERQSGNELVGGASANGSTPADFKGIQI